MAISGRISQWKKLPLTLTELCIDTTLQCGQSFRWRKINDEWICSLRGRVVVLKQDESCLHYKSMFPNVSPSPSKDIRDEDNTDKMLYHYFDLKHDLGALYEQWSKADPIFKKLAPQFGGVRILNQDAWEALICFICSSNNNISRISSMAHKLCKYYGAFITKIGDEEYHDFPTPEALTNPKVESHLRELGFGYRAQYIANTAKIVASKPPGWLNGLRNPESPAWGAKPALDSDSDAKPVTYKEAHGELISLSGVGPKVADCVCLMGLGWSESVPIDTHVWQIAQRDYKFGKTKTKTFTKATYDAVGDHFRELWGKQAGWAHSVLFTADLKAFAKAKDAAKEVMKVKKEAEEEEDEDGSVDSPAVKVEVKVEEEVTAVEEAPRGRSKRKRAATAVVKTEDALEAKREYTVRTRSQKKAKGQ
ncbi:hypothetical protein MKZ38_005011 [Zalerion maritima]|uniref:DNA-(apurinic or apyrimidinic site) lyase n=1 Tax=Zalerion maritima TaxID=339359 RepID=A0AAD5WPJ4_9PEZI|nr:hypothetical protein MKZ38_005011 [Zalerion maritima]